MWICSSDLLLTFEVSVGGDGSKQDVKGSQQITSDAVDFNSAIQSWRNFTFISTKRQSDRLLQPQRTALVSADRQIKQTEPTITRRPACLFWVSSRKNGWNLMLPHTGRRRQEPTVLQPKLCCCCFFFSSSKFKDRLKCLWF